MSQIDDLLDKWEELNEQGDAISPEELCRNHPELLSEVQWQINALKAVNSNFGVAREDEAPADSVVNTSFIPPQDIQLSARYQLKGCHATGGLGQVFIAHDKVLHRKVAIKFPRRQGMSQDQIARFEQEARITSKLDHPGIVPVHGLDRSSAGEPCYVMRFVDGETLQQVVEKRKSDSATQPTSEYYHSKNFRHLLQSFVSVCKIVAFAHGKNILHRDIKPSNILLGPYGETMLLDWGIAKELKGKPECEESPIELAASYPFDSTTIPRQFEQSPVFTQAGRTMGTPAYASPEQMLGRSELVGPASDIYSLGATLFYIVANQAPLEAAGWSEYLEMLKTPSTQLTNLLPIKIPRNLLAICDKALRVIPSERFRTASELADDVDRYLAREPISVHQDSVWVKIGRTARKHPVASGAIIASTLVLTVGSLIGSAVVAQKNTDLKTVNQNLRAALIDVEQANDVALGALRGMVDDVVALKFAQGDTLSDADREYIQSILQRYMSLSDLQKDSEHTLIVRAEAYLQIGLMHYRLEQPVESAEALRNASRLYQELRDVFGDQESIFDYMSSLENLATTQVENGEAAECLLTLQTAFAMANESVKNFAVGNPIYDDTVASLHRVKAEAHILLGDSEAAIEELERSIAILNQILEKQPDRASSLFAVSQACRMIGTLFGERATNREVLQAAKAYCDRSVDSLTNISIHNTGVPRYAMALVWAHFDRSSVHEKIGDLNAAVLDLTKAEGVADVLSAQYPLITAYKDCQPVILMRRGQLHLQSGNLRSAIREARNLSDGPLSLEQMNFAVDVLERALHEPHDDDFTIEDTLDHISRVLLLRGDLHFRKRAFQASREDYLSAESHLRDLLALRPSVVIYYQSLVKALLGQSQLQHQCGNQSEALKFIQHALLVVDSLMEFDSALGEALRIEVDRTESELTSQAIESIQ